MWLLRDEGEDGYAVRRWYHFAARIASSVPRGRTDQAEDVADGRHQDHKQVDQEEEAERDADVNGPAERLVGEQDLKQGPADLQREGKREGECYWQNCLRRYRTERHAI